MPKEGTIQTNILGSEKPSEQPAEALGSEQARQWVRDFPELARKRAEEMEQGWGWARLRAEAEEIDREWAWLRVERKRGRVERQETRKRGLEEEPVRKRVREEEQIYPAATETAPHEPRADGEGSK